MNYNYYNAFTCPKCGALNHGGFSTCGCGLCGYTGYIIHSSGNVTVTINSSGSNVVGMPIQKKTITITESQFDEAWGKYSELDKNHEDMKQDIKKDLGF